MVRLSKWSLECEAKRLYQQEYQKQHNRERREQVLDGYGHYCACCGEIDSIFLCIDHVNHGKGNPAPKADRVNLPTFWTRIIKAGFPPEYQILCYNCNFAKDNGGCPHAD